MLTAYIRAAMHRAHYEIIENGDEPFYAEIPELQGVWAVGATLEAARDELQEALEAWLLYSIAHGHRLPELDGVSLMAPAVA